MDAIAVVGAPTPLVFASVLEMVCAMGGSSALDFRTLLAVVSFVLKMNHIHLRRCAFVSVVSAFTLASCMGWCIALLFALAEYGAPTFGKRARDDLKVLVRTRLQEDPGLSKRRLADDEGLPLWQAQNLLREVRAELSADGSDDALKARVRNLLLADPSLSRSELVRLEGCTERAARALLCEARTELSSHISPASGGGVEELEAHIPHLVEHFGGRFFYATELAQYTHTHTHTYIQTDAHRDKHTQTHATRTHAHTHT